MGAPGLESLLPALNAALNATSAVLAWRGLRAIRRGDVARHRRLMLAAAGASAAFLASYLLKTALFGTTPFAGPSWLRVPYLLILATHMGLAALATPLVVVVLLLGLRDRREAHRRLARVTLPAWLYVSVTGVLVYLLLRPYYG